MIEEQLNVFRLPGEVNSRLAISGCCDNLPGCDTALRSVDTEYAYPQA